MPDLKGYDKKTRLRPGHTGLLEWRYRCGTAGYDGEWQDWTGTTFLGIQNNTRKTESQQIRFVVTENTILGPL